MTFPSVVICDPGVDDSVALMMLAGLGHVPNSIIATAGNSSLDDAYRNTSGMAGALGWNSNLARGADSAIGGPYPDTGEPFHGSDGLGGHAGDLPVAGLAHPDAMSLISGAVLATGPMTVVAQAVMAGRPITEIVWMGGSISAGGTMTAAAEFNSWMDPEAVDLVFSNDVPLAVVPLDVTSMVKLEADEVAFMAGLGQAGKTVAGACAYLLQRDGAMIPHDAVAVVAQTNPDLFRWEQRWVRCETTGTVTRGMTVADRRRTGETGTVRVAMGIDAPAVKDRIMDALRALA